MAYTEKYVTDAGAGDANGTSLAHAWPWATMLTSLAAGERANVQGAITRTTAADVFTNAGTAALPMAIRGINSTDGDLEGNGRTAGGALITTNFPVVTYTTGKLTLANYMVVEHMSFTSAIAGQTVTAAAQNAVRRVKFENTHASSSSSQAFGGGSNYPNVIDCDGITSSSNASSVALYAGRGRAYNCLAINTSGIAITLDFAGSCEYCMIRDSATGVSFLSNSVASIVGCSFRGITGNHINHSSANNFIQVQNCVAWGTGGSSKWFNSTTSVRPHIQQTNAIGNMGAADTNKGDWPVTGEIALSADPFVSSTDLRLNNTPGGGAACRAAGLFLYSDLGAWQHQESSGGGPLSGPGRLIRN